MSRGDEMNMERIVIEPGGQVSLGHDRYPDRNLEIMETQVGIGDPPGALPKHLSIHAGYCSKCGTLRALMGKDGAYCPKCEPEKASSNPQGVLHIKGG